MWRQTLLAVAGCADLEYLAAECVFRAGINKQLRAKGVQEGDTVVVGGIELQWSDDQSEGALYAAWREDKLRRGTAWQGTARWPHAV